MGSRKPVIAVGVKSYFYEEKRQNNRYKKRNG